ncbi:hypothetical protein LV75_004737 [Actinokineospora diospyrosa]|uniref:Uncharacterized protein n=1 Tax=Actinokineospora diospyrosa TaxID=103728 RepID=A0ABT1IHU5_9PSEU|nr:hypothetical protein [Actinokineospora diospyrosa]
MPSGPDAATAVTEGKAAGQNGRVVLELPAAATTVGQNANSSARTGGQRLSVVWHPALIRRTSMRSPRAAARYRALRNVVATVRSSVKPCADRTGYWRIVTPGACRRRTPATNVPWPACRSATPSPSPSRTSSPQWPNHGRFRNHGCGSIPVSRTSTVACFAHVSRGGSAGRSADTGSAPVPCMTGAPVRTVWTWLTETGTRSAMSAATWTQSTPARRRTTACSAGSTDSIHRSRARTVVESADRGTTSCPRRSRHSPGPSGSCKTKSRSRSARRDSGVALRSVCTTDTVTSQPRTRSEEARHSPGPVDSTVGDQGDGGFRAPGAVHRLSGWNTRG